MNELKTGFKRISDTQINSLINKFIKEPMYEQIK